MADISKSGTDKFYPATRPEQQPLPNPLKEVKEDFSTLRRFLRSLSKEDWAKIYVVAFLSGAVAFCLMFFIIPVVLEQQGSSKPSPPSISIAPR